MIAFELSRRSLVSSGKAAELLGIPRLESVPRASELGIPYFRFTDDEWQAEVAHMDHRHDPRFPRSGARRRAFRWTLSVF